MTDTKVSIIIPIFNMEEYIEQCIESIINQTLKEIEIICINDGSTDSSQKIVDNYSKRDKRITVINQNNKGVAVSRNLGITLSCGKYLLFMDPDDYYPSNDVVEKLYLAAENNGVQIAGGSLIELYNNKMKKPSEKYFTNKEGVIKYSDYQYDFGFQRFIFLRELIVNNDLRFPDYIHFEDPPFLTKALCVSNVFYLMNEVVYCHRIGHQDKVWSCDKCCDLMRGTIDSLKLSSNYGLAELHQLIIKRFNDEYTKKYIQPCIQSTFDVRMLKMMLAVNDAVDIKLLNNVDTTKEYCIDSLKTICCSNSQKDDNIVKKTFSNIIDELYNLIINLIKK